MYKLQKDPLTNEICSVYRSDGWSIPFDLDNTDYQEYLAWKEKGNEPLPADEPASQPADE
jgi:hypothetical protein